MKHMRMFEAAAVAFIAISVQSLVVAAILI